MLKTCALCGRKEYQNICVEECWTPSFYIESEEIDQPICFMCTDSYRRSSFLTHVNEDGDVFLRSYHGVIHQYEFTYVNGKEVFRYLAKPDQAEIAHIMNHRPYCTVAYSEKRV